MGIGPWGCWRLDDRGFGVVRRTVAGARFGVRDWLIQRVAGAYLALYTLLLLAYLALHWPVEKTSWAEWFRLPGMRVATLLAFGALFLHAWVGMRNIFMDYVKNAGVRLSLHVVVILLLVAYFVWVVEILWSLPVAA